MPGNLKAFNPAIRLRVSSFASWPQWLLIAVCSSMANTYVQHSYRTAGCSTRCQLLVITTHGPDVESPSKSRSVGAPLIIYEYY